MGIRIKRRGESYKLVLNKIKRIFSRLLPFIGIGMSLLMLLHSLWQLDLIAVRPIWDTQNWIKWFLPTGYSNFADMSFQCGFWFRTSLGNAYDFYLSMCVASWFLLAVSMWFWRRQVIKEWEQKFEVRLQEEFEKRAVFVLGEEE